ncbi:MAG: heavy metal-binding domain-containing protein, partial [Myxococcota bacterium]
MKTKWLLGAVLLFFLGLLVGAAIRKDSKSQDIRDASIDHSHWTCSMHPEIHASESGACPI